MIAKVRIAPVEQWCPELRKVFEPLWAEHADEMEPSSGSVIGIETSSMRVSPMCGGREWHIAVLQDGIIATDPSTGREVDPNKVDGWACEHMLEMD